MTLPRSLCMLQTVKLVSCPGLVLFLIAGVAGCTSGTETGNPFTGELSYTGHSSAPERFAVGSGGEVLTVQSAWFALDDVTVSASGDCGLESDASFTVAALGVGDHAAGNHNFTAFETDREAFCSVELPFVPVPDASSGAPEELRGHAILLQGELADGTPFSLLSDAVPTVRLQAPAGGFELTADTARTLLAFDFAVWLGDVDFAAATQQDGQISISPDSNSELLEQFESNLSAGVSLYRDRDGDGVVDEDPELLASAP